MPTSYHIITYHTVLTGFAAAAAEAEEEEEAVEEELEEEQEEEGTRRSRGLWCLISWAGVSWGLLLVSLLPGWINHHHHHHHHQPDT